MNQAPTVDPARLQRANLLGFTTMAKAAGVEDADLPKVTKRAFAYFDRQRVKQAKVRDLILSQMVATPAAPAAAK